MVFVKKTKFEGNGFTFKLKNMETNERFALWDNTLKTYLKENTILTTLKGAQKIDKYISLTPEEKQRYTRKLSFKRDVIDLATGEEVQLDLPKTAEDALIDKISTIQVMGGNVNSFAFTVKKTGTKLNTKYSVDIAKSAVVAGNPAPASSTIVVQPNPIETKEVKTIPDFESVVNNPEVVANKVDDPKLTNDENKLIKSLKESPSFINYNEQMIRTIILDNLVNVLGYTSDNAEKRTSEIYSFCF
jgi:hypothetical protein